MLAAVWYLTGLEIPIQVPMAKPTMPRRRISTRLRRMAPSRNRASIRRPPCSIGGIAPSDESSHHSDGSGPAQDPVGQVYAATPHRPRHQEKNSHDAPFGCRRGGRAVAGYDRSSDDRRGGRPMAIQERAEPPRFGDLVVVYEGQQVAVGGVEDGVASPRETALGYVADLDGEGSAISEGVGGIQAGSGRAVVHHEDRGRQVGSVKGPLARDGGEEAGQHGRPVRRAHADDHAGPSGIVLSHGPWTVLSPQRGRDERSRYHGGVPALRKREGPNRKIGTNEETAASSCAAGPLRSPTNGSTEVLSSDGTVKAGVMFSADAATRRRTTQVAACV